MTVYLTVVLMVLSPLKALAFVVVQQALFGLPYAQTGLVDSYRQVLRHLHAVGVPLRAERRA
ncbi:hypothetical protein ACFWMG_39485 [Streptomyces sp. NPDC127074]|uniref:hypothetical protein n=1 Tax=Streptomyces sp. NPDC127074 TaxID=3347130 RepID=UPI00366345F5